MLIYRYTYIQTSLFLTKLLHFNMLMLFILIHIIKANNFVQMNLLVSR